MEVGYGYDLGPKNSRTFKLMRGKIVPKPVKILNWKKMSYQYKIRDLK